MLRTGLQFSTSTPRLLLWTRVFILLSLSHFSFCQSPEPCLWSRDSVREELGIRCLDTWQFFSKSQPAFLPISQTERLNLLEKRQFIECHMQKSHRTGGYNSELGPGRQFKVMEYRQLHAVVPVSIFCNYMVPLIVAKSNSCVSPARYDHFPPSKKSSQIFTFPVNAQLLLFHNWNFC